MKRSPDIEKEGNEAKIYFFVPKLKVFGNFQ
jgi:hypothetical protein